MHKQCNDKILELDALRTDRQKLQARNLAGSVCGPCQHWFTHLHCAMSALFEADYRNDAQTTTPGLCVCRRAATA